MIGSWRQYLGCKCILATEFPYSKGDHLNRKSRWCLFTLLGGFRSLLFSLMLDADYLWNQSFAFRLFIKAFSVLGVKSTNKIYHTCCQGLRNFWDTSYSSDILHKSCMWLPYSLIRSPASYQVFQGVCFLEVCTVQSLEFLAFHVTTVFMSHIWTLQ